MLDHKTVTRRYNKSNVARELLCRDLQKALEEQLARCLHMPPPAITPAGAAGPGNGRLIIRAHDDERPPTGWPFGFAWRGVWQCGCPWFAAWRRHSAANSV